MVQWCRSRVYSVCHSENLTISSYLQTHDAYCNHFVNILRTTKHAIYNDMAEDSTQDILDRYNLAKGMSPGGFHGGFPEDSPVKDDDLSLYSEGSIFREKENLSPQKPTPSTKKPRNPLFTPRRPKDMNSGYSPARARFESSSKRNANISDISMDRNIENFINKTVLDLDPDLETDKTDLLIRETHNLINDVPSSIMATKEGEEYQKTISILINKLVRKCESLTVENDRLKSNDQKPVIDQLKSRVEALTKSNELHKNDLQEQNEDFLKMLNESNSLKHENELLRSKLIKYKNLYEAKQSPPTTRPSSKGTKSATTNQQPKPRKAGKMSQLIQLYNEMATILNKEKKSNAYMYYEEPESESEPEPEPEVESESEDMPRLLKQFEKIVNRKSPEPGSKSDDYKQILQTNNQLYEKLLQVLTSSGTKDLQGPESHPLETAPQTGPTATPQEPPRTNLAPSLADSGTNKTPDKEKNIVLQCYLCCENLHNGKPVTSPTDGNRKCERCSTVSSKPPMADFNHTIDLMGEYKWTL